LALVEENVSQSHAVEILSLAPMAVLPEFQRKDIGSALVKAGIEACRKLPHSSIVVLGHPDLYPRFGF
jgi:putative acetyltransferase